MWHLIRIETFSAKCRSGPRSTKAMCRERHSTKGVGVAIAVLLIGAGFIYLGTSFAPSSTNSPAPVTTPNPRQ